MRALRSHSVRYTMCVLVLAISGCTDGYPDTEEPLALNFGMSREAVQQAMNRIGGHRYLEHRWRYKLDDNCQLRIESSGLQRRSAVLPASDTGWTPVMVANAGSGLYEVSVRDAQDSPVPGVQVIAGANWSDASQIKWLLDYLPVVCRGTGGQPD